jgi:hypothetical protein
LASVTTKEEAETYQEKTGEMLRMTERDMLRFESIFDLLIRLEFQEDRKNERMVATGGKQSVSFAEIGGRTVAEFVRWGLHNGLLISCQKERP